MSAGLGTFILNHAYFMHIHVSHRPICIGMNMNDACSFEKLRPAGTLLRLVNSRSTITASHVQNDTGTVSKFIQASYFTMHTDTSHFAQTFAY
jgi:hypothetical protein